MGPRTKKDENMTHSENPEPGEGTEHNAGTKPLAEPNDGALVPTSTKRPRLSPGVAAIIVAVVTGLFTGPLSAILTHVYTKSEEKDRLGPDERDSLGCAPHQTAITCAHSKKTDLGDCTVKLNTCNNSLIEITTPR